jgi:hypothetical protein
MLLLLLLLLLGLAGFCWSLSLLVVKYCVSLFDDW